jgi:tRNA threonylcarbamoyl adenosine modification protein YeaZ
MSARAPWLLALHSSSDTLAVGLQRLGDPEAAGSPLEPLEPPRLASFPLGRQLSNDLLPCVEQLLPAEHWPELGRLVVATGPGGFTGTRLTLVLARTLAQQLAIPLHGFSSFLLMARRLAAPGQPMAAAERFWLSQVLPRRGVVAGCYQPDPLVLGGMAERVTPRLFQDPASVAEPQLPAQVEPEADAAQLLELGQLAAAARLPGPWQPVLPLYPTSPVDQP